MWAKPDDRDVAERMRNAHSRAQTALGVLPEPDVYDAWGWRGRTLSQPVIASDGPAWLRLACARYGEANATFWDGSIAAETAIPKSVPRPRLRDSHDWNDEPWQYRAELYNRVAARPAATTAAIVTPPDLPPSWWAALRTVLDDIATVPTRRRTIDQPYLDHAMPRFLGTPIDTSASSWTTAHGDFHFANLTSPTLHVLDWEGWGLAPTGYDAAMLHTHSLLAPAVASRIRSELTHVLDTPAGRFAELVVITELLHSTTRGDNLDLTEPLRNRAAHLLERAIPHCEQARQGATAPRSLWSVAGRPSRSVDPAEN
jgi:hypothetical protein